jgi:hypothetical protein
MASPAALSYANLGCTLELVGPASNLVNCVGTQLDFDTTYAWSVENRLPLCLQNCQCLLVGVSNIQHVFMIDGSAAQAVDELTDLDITHFTTNSYDTHISNIVRKHFSPLASSGGHSQLAKRLSI